MEIINVIDLTELKFSGSVLGSQSGRIQSERARCTFDLLKHPEVIIYFVRIFFSLFPYIK